MSTHISISQTMAEARGQTYSMFADYVYEHGVAFGSRADIVWDGTLIHAAGFTGTSDLTHEFAHWLIAHPALRDAPNFGLGTDWRGGQAVQLVSDEVRLAVEAAQHVLGLRC